MLIKQTIARVVKSAAERAFPVSLIPKVDQASRARGVDYVSSAPKDIFQAYKKDYDKSEVCFGYFNSREVADCIFVQLERHPMVAWAKIAGDGSLEFEICSKWLGSNLEWTDPKVPGKAVLEFPDFREELVDVRQLLMGKFIKAITSGQGKELKYVYAPVDSMHASTFKAGRVFNHLGSPSYLPTQHQNYQKLLKCSLHRNILASTLHISEPELESAEQLLTQLKALLYDLQTTPSSSYQGEIEAHRTLALELVRYRDTLEDCASEGSSYSLLCYISSLARMLQALKPTWCKETALLASKVLTTSLTHLDLL